MMNCHRVETAVCRIIVIRIQIMRNFPSSTQRLSFNLSRPVSRDPDSVSVWDAEYDFLFRPEDQS